MCVAENMVLLIIKKKTTTIFVTHSTNCSWIPNDAEYYSRSWGFNSEQNTKIPILMDFPVVINNEV